MPIQVVCPGCTSRFTVSDQFAGRTGPCPKCKKPITVPASATPAVTIHEPEPTGPAAAGRAALVPFRSTEKPVTGLAFALTAAGAIGVMLLAWLVGLAYRPAAPPDGLLLGAAFLVALATVPVSYVALRQRDIEPYRGRSFAVRCLICAAVYTLVWGAKGLLPPSATTELWQWLYLAPIFLAPGALAAFAAFDLDQGSALAHVSFYVAFTVLLRWLAGLPPL